MTNVDVPSAPVPSRPRSTLFRWLVARDPGLLVCKRSIRAAVVVPSVFAVTHELFSDPQVGLFGAFGAFALLLFVEFTGPVRSRAASYGALFLVGAGLVTLGTLVSTSEVAAVFTMAVVGFVVLFAGIAAPQAATASTAALLTFVLPVSIAAPASAVGPRLVGWFIAAAVAVPACLVVWPPPWHDDLRRRLAAAVTAVANLAEARAREDDTATEEARVSTELGRLRRQFSATPYPPTGAAAGAVALSKLVGRVEWVAGNSAVIGNAHWVTEPPAARAVTSKVAETLHHAAALLCDGDGHPVQDPARVAALEQSTRELDALITAALQSDVSMVADGPRDHERSVDAVDRDGEPASLTAALDPGFHARAIGIATEMVADGALEAAGARGVLDRKFGILDESTTHVFAHRVRSHLSLRSVWFRNAVRGAIGLAIAVAIAEITDVQHGFWVVLGTMSVLRSSVFGTGATAVRAVGGTAVGVVIASAIMLGVADHTALLWALLPVGVFVSGIAPSMISFVAGQAAFSVTVIMLFNIVQPVGWKVGLTRIEDVAIGCGVSIVVGVLFWPRGATAALGRALSDAFVASSGYLADAVDRLTRTSRHVSTTAAEQAAHRCYLLLDDAFRQFFAERGAKVVSLETISRLFTGSNRIRLAAFTLATLPVEPPAPGRSEVDSVAMAEAVLRDAYAASHRWYQEFADMLVERRASIDEPLPHEEVLHQALRRAFEDVRAQRRSDRVRTTLQMLWADELLESQGQMQADLLASADLFLRQRRRSILV